MKYYLGLDEGTTGTTAVIFDERFNPVARGYSEHTQYYPAPGQVEHDADEIFESALCAVRQALDTAGIRAEQLTAIGIDHEGESVVAWDAVSGKPLGRCIVWQDKRTDKMCADINERYGDEIEACTGLRPSAYFSASKIAWILNDISRDNTEANRRKRGLCAGDLGSYLIFRLTGGRSFITDASTASRTMLMDLKTCRWSDRMLSIWQIDKGILPDITDSCGMLGETSPDVFFGAKVPISGLLCDQQASLYGHGCLDTGGAKITYGTGCFMLMNVGESPGYSHNGLLPTVAWRMDGKTTYALDGGAYIAGAAVQWLRDGLGIIRDAAQSEEMARSVPDNGGVIFVPAFAGLAAPYWDDSARGLLTGLTGGVTAAHVARAVLEGCAYQAADLIEAMAGDAGMPITSIRCDGGMAKNSFLMQFQADITGVNVIIPAFTDMTARGCAMAAAKGAGERVLTPEDQVTVLKPRMDKKTREALKGRYRKAVRRSMNWA